MKRLNLLFIGLLFCISCVKDTLPMSLPYSPVYFKVDVNGLDYELRGALNYKIYTESSRRTDNDRFGYAGLLVVRNITDDGLYAFDLCCPHEKDRSIVVTSNHSGEAICPKCKTVYDTMYGFGIVKSGVSKQPLQVYRVRKDASRKDVFYVVN